MGRYQANRTLSVDDLVRARGIEGISKSQVSRLCGETNERVHAFLACPIEGDWPYVWLDATHVEVRRDHRIVSIAVIVAVGVQHRWQARGPWHDDGLQRGRALLGRVPA